MRLSISLLVALGCAFASAGARAASGRNDLSLEAAALRNKAEGGESIDTTLDHVRASPLFQEYMSKVSAADHFHHERAYLLKGSPCSGPSAKGSEGVHPDCPHNCECRDVVSDKKKKERKKSGAPAKPEYVCRTARGGGILGLKSADLKTPCYCLEKAGVVNKMVGADKIWWKFEDYPVQRACGAIPPAPSDENPGGKDGYSEGPGKYHESRNWIEDTKAHRDELVERLAESKNLMNSKPPMKRISVVVSKEQEEQIRAILAAPAAPLPAPLASKV